MLNFLRPCWLIGLVAMVLLLKKDSLAKDLPSLAKIPLLTFEQASQHWTEFNTEYQLDAEGNAKVRSKIVSVKANRALSLHCSDIQSDADSVSIEVSFFKRLNDRKLATYELQKQVKGISLQVAAVSKDSVPIAISIRDINHRVFHTEFYEASGGEFQEIEMPIDLSLAKSIRIDIKSSAVVVLDDFCFLSSKNDFEKIDLQSNHALLSWLSRCSRSYFLDGYVEIESDKAVVYETSRTNDTVTISGIGFALAAHVLADLDKDLPAGIANRRIRRLLNWIEGLDCETGLHGWHGFPNHYLRADGKARYSKVSTVDWAICAAAIRVVKSHYQDDQRIVSLCNRILSRVDWSKAVDSENLFVMGFEAQNGVKDPYRWGLAFSEETELVCLEAIASGQVNEQVLDYVKRESKNGHKPSWFGAGFTYNWLQLWSGPLAGYQQNSQTAYRYDLTTCQKAFDLPLMGLTACMTVSSVNENGYARWNRYISHQGSCSHATEFDSEVIQISPAPYGASLALPFLEEEAITALRTYVRLVDPHPTLGLPDSIRIKDLTEGKAPIPNWEQVDINIGPMMLAIEQVSKNRIGTLYQKNSQIQLALTKLIESFGSN